MSLSDHTTFSYSNLTIGVKIYFIPGRLRFHLLLNGGLSYKYIYQEYIGGSLSGNPSDDERFHILSMDLGLGLRYNINSNIRIRTELNAFIALNGNIKHNDSFNNGAIKLGIDYFFK